MDAEAAVPWVTIASYSGLNAEVEADLLVANLQGVDIPAMRLPNQPLGMFVTKIVVPAIMPIQVIVPGDREAEARELLDEQPRQSVPPRVRSVVRWYLGAVLVTGIVSGPLSRGFRDVTVLAALGLGLTVVVGVMLVVSELRLAAAVQRERPTRPGVGVVIATVLVIGAGCFLLLYPLGVFGYDKTHTLSRESMAIMVLVGYTLLTALLLRQARMRGETVNGDEGETGED
jgi:hypothetical protein